jgi:hypothetical protein
LAVTLTGETGNLDAIAFSFVSEELVERSAYLTSQNMKVDAYEHVTALDTTVGKIKLFSIGMSSSTTSTFPIKYVIQKCFTVNIVTISLSALDAHVILFYIIYCTITIPHHFFPRH